MAPMPHIPLIFSFFLTDRNEVVAKVIFLLVSVILLTGGSVSVHAGKEAPPWERSSACWEGSPPGKDTVHAGKEAPLGKQCMLGRKHPLGKKQPPRKEAVHAGKEAPPNGQ